MSKLHMCEEKGAHLPECSCECEYYAFGKINVENALISADQASDTLTLIAGDNIFLYPDLDNNSIRIEARDQGTVYEGGTGIFVEDHSINHTNSINEGTVGSTTDTSGYTITVPYVTYDAQGHISDAGNRTHTVPTPPTYSAGTGLTLNGTTFNHSNSVTAGTAGSTTDTSGTSISIPYVTFDAQGHITAKGTRTHTVPSAPTYSAGTGLSMSGTTINHSNSVTAGTAGSTTDTSGNTFTIPYVTFDAQGHITAKGTRNHTVPSGTTYSAGTGLSLSGTTFNHSNSVTAGTAGSSTDTSGNTFTIPYVTYDSQGHITASGTRNHTVSGGTTYTAGRGMELVNDAFSRLPLIDEVVCMAVSRAPGLTGTYSLIKRCFEPMFVENQYIVWNDQYVDENHSSTRCAIMRTDDRIVINMRYVNFVAVSDNTTLIGKIPLYRLGLEGIKPSYTVAWSDSGDAIAYHHAYSDGTDVIIEVMDYLPHGSSIVDASWHLQIDLVFAQEDMSLAACNRFYYKRTA